MESKLILFSKTADVYKRQFPRWMKEKGHDIAGKLNTKTEKEDFLHKGVDVLLNELDKRLSSFRCV